MTARARRALDAGGARPPAWRALGGAPAILEGFVHFEREFSVIAARGADGDDRRLRPRRERPPATASCDRSTVPAARRAGAGRRTRR